MIIKNQVILTINILFLSILIIGCDNAKKSEVENVELNLCNKRLDNNKDIVDYIPENIKSDKVLNKYVEDSYESFSDSEDKMFDFLNVIAEVKNDSIVLEKMDNKNALSVIKGGGKVLKTFGKGAIAGTSLLFSASGFAFDYKEKFNEFKKIYSQNKLDSLRKVINCISVLNKSFDNYLKYETNKIKTFTSFRSTGLVPSNIIEESKMNETFEAYDKLFKESRRVEKVLLFNKMKNTYCENVSLEIDQLLKFYESNNLEYSYNLDIFKDYATLINEVKLNLHNTKKYIKNHENDFNDEITNELKRIIKEYDEIIIKNISNLNIYNWVEDIQNQIQIEIKNGSNIYFQ
jgi:hypothetical protein